MVASNGNRAYAMEFSPIMLKELALNCRIGQAEMAGWLGISRPAQAREAITQVG